MKVFRIFLLLLFSAVVRLPAEFVEPFPVPLRRLRESFQEMRRRHPEDAEPFYRLGRLHYLAYEMGVEAGFTHTPRDPGQSSPSRVQIAQLLEGWRQRGDEAGPGKTLKVSARGGEDAWEARVMNPAERAHHALQAYMLLSAARRKDPEKGLYALTYGSFVLSWMNQDDEIRETVKRTPLRSLGAEQARKAFKDAWELTREKDLRRKYLPLEGGAGLVSAEAARNWLKLGAPRGDRGKETASRMRKDLKRLSKLPSGPVTPLVFFPGGLEPRKVPVDTEARVEFDLPGDGSGGFWTWLEEGAVILVWDPERSGSVQSGHQLFGAYTWRMFWKDGFEALSILDTNRDGELRGTELRGLSGWRDLDPLGVADPGEVTPLNKLGVEAIRIKSLSYPDPHALAWNPVGVVMEDGRVLPIWDWLATPVE